MITKSDTNLDALASKYATLKVQADKIKVQMEAARDELLLQMHPGDVVATPEYKVTCNSGRSSIVWTCPDEQKKSLQNELIKRGVMDAKVGDPFIQVRFLKQAEVE